MNAFLYGLRLQFKLDIRSKSLLITCYIVPLLFFFIMGGIFTSLMPEAKHTLIASMTIMGVSMGALIGVPQTVAELYGSDIHKMYKANGIPVYFGLLSIMISACLHLLLMSMLILIISPIAFHATLPTSIPIYLLLLTLFIIVTLSVASVLGIIVNDSSKLTMFSQFIFLPSIMLSGIMFPSSLLPYVLQVFGKLFPATWGFHLLTSSPIELQSILSLCGINMFMIVLCYYILHHKRSA